MNKVNKLTKQAFDEIIKQNLIESGVSEVCFTYKIEKREYPEYYTASEFKEFVKEMEKDYFSHFKKFYGDKNTKENQGGKGGELVKKKGRYGFMPPKMASVASSSRFCYLALRDGTDVLIPDRRVTKDEVEFEKECRIFDSGLTAPQLDAYIADEKCDIFIEAKCHEIFDSHKAVFKKKYWEYLNNDKTFCKVLSKEFKDKETFELPLSLFNVTEKSSTSFDIKQFICHLLGIARQNNGKKSKLVYLFFKPKVDDIEKSQQIENKFNDLSCEIKKIFTCDTIKDFCKNNNIELMAIAEKSKLMEKLNEKNIKNLLDKSSC